MFWKRLEGDMKDMPIPNCDDSMTTVNWSRVALFLGSTFLLTYLLDLVLWLFAGYNTSQATGIMLQLQMLLPAFCAIALEMLVFKQSPLYSMRIRMDRQRWFYYCFLAYTTIFAAFAAASIYSIDLKMLKIAVQVTQGMTLLGLILLIAMRVMWGREEAFASGLAWGSLKYWLLFVPGVVLFYGLQTALNYLFNLGKTVDILQFMAQIAPTHIEQFQAIGPTELLLITGIQTMLLSSFIGLLIAFGEEYGWRGFLQRELIRMGRTKGILLLGIIWGLWHMPVILMGHNYPGHPVEGVFLMIAYTVGLGFVLSYSVLKSGSIILAAFLHALNNQANSFFSMMVYTPNDPVFSFGIGLYGLASLALLVCLMLRDPIWKN
jgi:membrane protease YdiL (CAAX protease family)